MNQQGLQDLLTYQFQSYFINIGKRRMIDEINFEFKQELHKRRRNRQNTNCSHMRSLLVKIFQNSILKTSKKMDGASENSMKFKIKITNQSNLDFSKVIQIEICCYGSK